MIQSIFLVWLLALLPTAVLAHDGSARVVLNQYEAAPGQPVELSGINLGTDLTVQVMLVGEKTAVVLGSALCDGHGDFIQQFALPTDLPDGVYAIQAVDTSMVGLSVVLAETRFKVDQTAVTSSANSPQVVTFTHAQAAWQQPFFLGLAGLTLLFFIFPTLIKRRRSKNNTLLSPRSPSH